MTEYECVTEFCLESTKKKNLKREEHLFVSISSTLSGMWKHRAVWNGFSCGLLTPDTCSHSQRQVLCPQTRVAPKQGEAITLGDKEASRGDERHGAVSGRD